jgi:hypothetical protein
MRGGPDRALPLATHPKTEGIEMRHRRHLGVSLALGVLIAAGLLVSPASAATTTGTWTQYPTGSTEFQAEVQQPINTANTSNWNSKSKGAIPVMFKLSSRTGPAAFESIYSDNPANTANDFAFLSFAPDTAMTFNDLTDLTANYAFSLGDCHGGSLRWQVRVDSNSNGVLDPYDPTTNPGGDKAVFIYYGLPPSFGNDPDGAAGPLSYEGGCTPTSNLGASQSGVNLLSATEKPVLRFDTTQFNGIFYNDYAGASAAAGTFRVWRASLVLDSGWQYAPNGDQRLSPGTTATVNGNTRQFISSAGGPFTATCDLPPATIEVSKNDPVVSGDINEAPVQASLADDGNAFRVVDCRYQYILSIPSLDGKGTYEVQIWINGTRVPTSPNAKVMFDIK